MAQFGFELKTCLLLFPSDRVPVQAAAFSLALVLFLDGFEAGGSQNRERKKSSTVRYQMSAEGDWTDCRLQVSSG